MTGEMNGIETRSKALKVTAANKPASARGATTFLVEVGTDAVEFAEVLRRVLLETLCLIRDAFEGWTEEVPER